MPAAEGPRALQPRRGRRPCAAPPPVACYRWGPLTALDMAQRRRRHLQRIVVETSHTTMHILGGTYDRRQQHRAAVPSYSCEAAHHVQPLRLSPAASAARSTHTLWRPSASTCREPSPCLLSERTSALQPVVLYCGPAWLMTASRPRSGGAAARAFATCLHAWQCHDGGEHRPTCCGSTTQGASCNAPRVACTLCYGWSHTWGQAKLLLGVSIARSQTLPY